MRERSSTTRSWQMPRPSSRRGRHAGTVRASRRREGVIWIPSHGGLLSISRPGFHAWGSRSAVPRAQQQTTLGVLAREAHYASVDFLLSATSPRSSRDFGSSATTARTRPRSPFPSLSTMSSSTRAGSSSRTARTSRTCRRRPCSPSVHFGVAASLHWPR